MSSNQKSSLLEYAVKELKQENVRLKDELSTIEKNELKKREELLNLQSAALEAAANGIVITDLNGNINWVNTAFTKLTGYSKEEVYNKNPKLLKSGVHDEEFYNDLWKTIKSGKNWHGELINKRKDGSFYNEEMTITPVKDEHGKITNFIAIKHNITNRKSNQRNLLINQNSVEQSALGILWVNTDAELIYSNQTVLNYLGYSKEEILNLTVLEIDPNWPTKEYFRNKLKDLKYEESLSFESTNIRKDGSQFPVDVVLKLINHENEEIIVAYIKDISKQKAIREIEKLVLASKTLDELLYGIHTILNRVISAPNCYVALLDDKTNMLSFPYFEDKHNYKPEPRKQRRGLTEYLIETGNSLILDKEAYSQLVNDNIIDQIGPAPSSWIGVPLYLQSKSSGALVFQSYEESSKLIDHDLEWLDSIASLVASVIEKKTTEKKLIQYQNSVENAALGMIWFNTIGDITNVNGRTVKYLQYTTEELLNMNISEINAETVPKNDFDNNTKKIRKESEIIVEKTLKRKDGTLFLAEMSLKMLNYENEEIIVAYIKDISRQKAIREIEQLLMSTNTLDELLPAVHQCIENVIPAPNCYVALLDEETNIVSFPYFIDEEDAPPLPRLRKNGSTEYVMQTGEPIILTQNIYKELIDDGIIDSIGALPVSWIGVPLFMENKSTGVLVIQSYDKDLEYSEKDLAWLNSIIKLVAAAIERKIYENRILENQKKFKAITNSTKDAIITVDEKSNIVLWNKAAEELFGYTEKEALGKSTFDLIIPDRFREQSEKRFQNISSIGKDFKGTFDIIAYKKDGSEFEVELSISITEIGNNWFNTGIWRDLSSCRTLRNSSEDEKEKIIKSMQVELTHLESNYNILNNIINIVPQRIYVKDKNSKFLKVNKSHIEFVGMKTEEDILDKTDQDFFQSNNAKEFVEEENRIMETGESITNKEHEANLQNGMVGWASTSKFPLYNKDGKSIGTFGITTDLTEKKKHEDELKDNHYKFRKLIENATLGIMRIDESGEIIMANPAMVELLDYQSEIELVSQKTDQIFSSIINKNKFMETLKRNEKIVGYEGVLLKKDGSLVDVKESAWAIKDKKDKVIYYEVIVEDITEQNQVLKILHESEFKYRMLIDKLSEAVFLMIENKFELVNSKFLDILQLPEEVIFKHNFNISDYLTDESKLLLKEREDKIAVGEDVPKVYILSLASESGEQKDVEVSVSYLNFNGKTAIQGIVRDLTEVRKQETQIRHLQKMEAIGTLAAGIAHEINTPSQFVNDNLTFLKETFQELTPILNFNNKITENQNEINTLVELVEEADLDYLLEEVPSAIDQSLEGISRIANIVGAMRDFAHTGPKDKISANLENIISSSITLSKNAWKYIAEIETNFDKSIPNIVCQPNDLNQVIVNMIVNSSHSMENKFENKDSLEGKIIISTFEKNENVEITISDNGLGMPEKIVKRIFDPFFTTKDVGKGTGQGLAIAYDIIVNKHNGDIKVNSEDGVGTTFLITLPIDQRTDNE